MTQITDYLPGSYPTAAERRRAEAERKAATPGFGEAARAAAESEWIWPWLERQFGPDQFSPRIGYRLTPDRLKELTEGIPQEYWDAFLSAQSDESAQYIRAKLLEVTEARKQLSLFGWKGTALQMGAAVLDPTAIAATVATEFVAGPAVYGAKLTRLQRLVRGGMVAAGTEVSLQAYLSTQDPQQGIDDIIYAGAGAFILGGGALAIFGNRADQAARSLRKQIELKDAAEAGLAPTPKGTAYWWRQLSPDEQRQQFEDLTSHLELDPEDLANLHAMEPDEAFTELFGRGQAGRPLQNPLAEVSEGFPSAEYRVPGEPGGLDLAAVPDPEPIPRPLGLRRFDMVGQLKESENPAIRRAAHLLAEDPFGGKYGQPAIQSAAEWVDRMNKTYLARWYRVALREEKAWAKAHGITWDVSLRERNRFFEEVGRATRREPGAYTTDPHVNAVADFQRGEYRRILRLAKDYVVPGFEEIPENLSYLTRVWSLANIDKAIARVGEANVIRLFKTALRRGSDGLSDDHAEKVARAAIHHISQNRWQTDVGKARMFTVGQRDTLRQILREGPADLTAEEIEDIVRESGARAAKGPERSLRRMSIDETTTIDALDDAGNALESIGIEDLVENNAESLYTLYTRQMFGEIGAQEFYRGMAPPEGAAPQTFEAIANRIRRAAPPGQVAAKKIERDLDKLKTLHDAVRGLRLGGTGPPAKAMRTLRAVNYLRIGNQFGFAQIAELGNLIGQGGLRVMAQQMPALGQIFRRARNGELANTLFQEIEAFTGVGTDWLRHQAVHRFDHAAGMADVADGRAGRLLKRGHRITNAVSFMAPVNVVLQRMSGAVAIQKFANIARGGRIPSATRLAALGMSADDAIAISGQLKKYATSVDGLFGRRVTAVNLDGWKDHDALSKFIVGIDKWSRRVIQENNIGNLSQWMTTDLGRTMIQFRTFVAVAWNKQLLFGLHTRDFQTFSAFSLSMVFGGLAYVAQTHANSIGRKDRKEYLEKRLAMDEIGKAAYQRAGFASITPGAIDSLLGITGFDPAFSYGRTSQMMTNFLTGNPTVDLLMNAQGAARGLIAPVVNPDYRFSQADVNALRRTMIFSNMLGLKNMIEAVTQDLPRRSRPRE